MIRIKTLLWAAGAVACQAKGWSSRVEWGWDWGYGGGLFERGWGGKISKGRCGMGAEGGRGRLWIEDVKGAGAVTGVARVKRFVTFRVGH